MSDRRIVYALESGEYSDFRVHAVFEREEDARAAVDAGAGDTYSEMTVYGTGEQPRRTTVHYANATVALKSGWSDREPFMHSHASWLFDGGAELQQGLREHKEPNGSRVHLHAEGEDPEAVMKRVADRYARLIAEREGVG